MYFFYLAYKWFLIIWIDSLMDKRAKCKYMDLGIPTDLQKLTRNLGIVPLAPIKKPITYILFIWYFSWTYGIVESYYVLFLYIYCLRLIGVCFTSNGWIYYKSTVVFAVNCYYVNPSILQTWRSIHMALPRRPHSLSSRKHWKAWSFWENPHVNSCLEHEQEFRSPCSVCRGLRLGCVQEGFWLGIL